MAVSKFEQYGMTSGSVTWATGARDDQSESKFETRLYRFGKIVIFQCTAELTSGYFSTTYTKICTLPAGFIPDKWLLGPATVGGNVWGANAKGKFAINPSGEVMIYASNATGDLTTCNHAQLYVTFVAEQ